MTPGHVLRQRKGSPLLGAISLPGTRHANTAAGPEKELPAPLTRAVAGQMTPTDKPARLSVAWATSLASRSGAARRQAVQPVGRAPALRSASLRGAATARSSGQSRTAAGRERVPRIRTRTAV